MITYSEEELKEILDNHRRWLYSEDGIKERANLCDADLSDADLRDAHLSGIHGNLRHVKSIQTETYYITYTSKVIQIGCQRHTIEDWKNFDDETIRKMDSKALDWWKKWKPILMQIIELAPCEDTKNEE